MYFHLDTNLDDYRKVVNFLEDTRDFLGALVFHGSASVFHPPLISHLQAAWNAKGPSRFKDAIRKANNCDYSQLEPHGLVKEELEAKLKLLEFSFGEFISNGGKKLLVKLLNVINNIIDSVLQALGIPGALKELKDLIRDSIAE